MKIKRLFTIFIIMVFCLTTLNITIPIVEAANLEIDVDLTNLTYTVDGETNEIKTYSQDEFEQFVIDFNSNSLPEIYITKFLYDGVSMVKTPDLDDFIGEGNETEIGVIGLTVINVNTTGNISFSGQLEKGMIAVNTNGVTEDINLILNGASINTGTSSKDYKKAPAIYVYNKDINYTGCKVTIKTVENTENYITGGKFKKVSLMEKDSLSNYSGYYNSNTTYTYEYEDDEGNELTENIPVSELYSTYTNYYGIYSSDELNNILFAKVQADNEDLADGDPYYYYKAAGAISSDIDLYFKGEGYLEVKSNKAEGIETKGNLTFLGGSGDYVIYSLDDCLNTTTSVGMGVQSSSVRNDLTIDVNSLYAIVDLEADEGDAIDSNGTLTINGGTIVALSKPGQDAGLDSNNGTYINGGTVIATGDMYDEISNASTQNFLALGFNNKPVGDTLITLLDSDENVLMSYKTDRTYSNLIYSSPELVNGTYYLYRDGLVSGTDILENVDENELYISGTYTKGIIQGYSQTGIQGGAGMPGGQGGTNGENPPEMPGGENQNGERPEMPNGEEGQTPPDGEPPTLPDGDSENRQEFQGQNGENNNTNASNKEFIISTISNLYSGVSNYTETETNNNEDQDNNQNENQNVDNNDATSEASQEDTSNSSTENNQESSNGSSSASDDSSTNEENNSTSNNNSSSSSSTDSLTSNGSTSNNSSGSTSGTNSSTSNSSNQSEEDTTTANTNIPYAGKSNIIIPLMGMALVLVIFFFIKYKKIEC